MPAPTITASRRKELVIKISFEDAATASISTPLALPSSINTAWILISDDATVGRLIIGETAATCPLIRMHLNVKEHVSRDASTADETHWRWVGPSMTSCSMRKLLTALIDVALPPIPTATTFAKRESSPSKSVAAL